MLVSNQRPLPYECEDACSRSCAVACGGRGYSPYVRQIRRILFAAVCGSSRAVSGRVGVVIGVVGGLAFSSSRLRWGMARRDSLFACARFGSRVSEATRHLVYPSIGITRSMAEALCRRVHLGNTGPLGPRLCSILHTDFRECSFQELGCIALGRGP